jgi:nitrogenase molybdenum-cofactor synthesis protein NifE
MSFSVERKNWRPPWSELIDAYRPKAAFVYSTCIVGIIGDDVAAVCRQVGEGERDSGAACPFGRVQGHQKGRLQGGLRHPFQAGGHRLHTGYLPKSINILGEFNIGGEAWLIKKYYERMGIEVVSIMTGDGRVEQVRRSHGAALNVVQCSGALTFLAEMMKETYGIPYIRASYFGIDDMAKALYDVADHFSEAPEIMDRTRDIVRSEVKGIMPELNRLRLDLTGKRAAIYVGGAFKAFSLIKALRYLGMKVVLVGSQTGNQGDYATLQEMCDEGTIILDDANPLELSKYIIEKKADLFIGGVKERPIAFKMGIGFCDHNHERKIPLAGFAGMLQFAREVHTSVTSPVWQFVPALERFT